MYLHSYILTFDYLNSINITGVMSYASIITNCIHAQLNMILLPSGQYTQVSPILMILYDKKSFIPNIILKKKNSGQLISCINFNYKAAH